MDTHNHNNDLVWDGNKYTKTYTVDKAYDDVQLKVVKNEQWWIGDEADSFIRFSVTQPSSFTVTYDAVTHQLAVTGDYLELKYDEITVAGGGEKNWLYGADWETQSGKNKMTEISPNVWQITYSDVGEAFDRQFKFSVDGGGEIIPVAAPNIGRRGITGGFGKPKGGSAPAFKEGVWFDAVWNGENINFDTDDFCDITLTLDLTNYDFRTKTGAKYQVDIDYNTYRAAGNYGEIFGSGVAPWSYAYNMKWQDGIDSDTTVSKTYTVDKAYPYVELKVGKNDTQWYGDAYGNNILFNITKPGSFIVQFDVVTHQISIIGDCVSFDFDYDYISVAGNGEGAWLNGQRWNEAAASNTMTEIAPDVWQISYKNVAEGFDRQVKFAVDGSWIFNFGKPKDGLDPAFVDGVWFDAFWDGDNINFDTEDTCTVILTLDLSDFNFQNKCGAKYKVDIVYNEDIVIGDVNKDGVFNVQDITALQRYLAEFINLDAEALANADVNSDGRFNVKDVTKMQRVLANIETF